MGCNDELFSNVAKAARLQISDERFWDSDLTFWDKDLLAAWVEFLEQKDPCKPFGACWEHCMGEDW